MSDKKIRTMVMAAVLAALACVATMVVQIPSPMNGYVNLGDCFVLLSGWLLGPWYGGAAAGIGSMLTDLLSGYGYYAPGTFIIKGLDALVAALIFKAMGRTSVAAIVSGVVGEIIMVVGYSLGRAFIYSTVEYALLKLPFQILQAAVGAIVAMVLCFARGWPTKRYKTWDDAQAPPHVILYWQK